VQRFGRARVEPGQWWKVAGEPSRRLLEVNGYQVAETQIEASSAVLLRPSGEHIVAFMADSPAFEGIGQVKARKLWETFGEDCSTNTWTAATSPSWPRF
jgi:exodeoxyribonuclease V alpha subunit